MVDYKDLYNSIASKWKEMDSWADEKKSDGDALDIKLFINSDEMSISLERDDVEWQIEEKRREVTKNEYMEELFKAKGNAYLYPFHLYDDGLAFYSNGSSIELSEDFLKHIDSFEIEIWED